LQEGLLASIKGKHFNAIWNDQCKLVRLDTLLLLKKKFRNDSSTILLKPHLKEIALDTN